MGTPSGKRPQSTRRKMRSRVKKRKKKRLSTYRGLTDRRSLTSTSPLLIRIRDVVVEEVVGVAAGVDVVEKEGSTAVIDKTVNAVKDKKEMVLHVVEGIVEAVAAEGIAVEEEGVAINKSLALPRKLSQHWDRSMKILKLSAIQICTRASLEFCTHYLHLERSYDLLILCREHSTGRT